MTLDAKKPDFCEKTGLGRPADHAFAEKPSTRRISCGLVTPA